MHVEFWKTSKWTGDETKKKLFSFLFSTGCCTVSRLSSIWSCGCHRNPDWQVGHPTTKMCHFLKKVFQVTCYKIVALQNPLELFLDFRYQKQLIRIHCWFFDNDPAGGWCWTQTPRTLSRCTQMGMSSCLLWATGQVDDTDHSPRNVQNRM